MTAFNFASYLGATKKAFIDNNGQGKAGEFLLNSVASQLDDEIYFDKSKVHALAHNKTEIDKRLVDALQQQKVVNSTLEYFDDEVFADLKQELISDVCNKIIGIIKDDKSVSSTKASELESLYQDEEIAKFLGEAFIYALHRPNKLDNFQQETKIGSEKTIVQVIQTGENNTNIAHMENVTINMGGAIHDDK